MQCALFARELSLVQGSKCLIFRVVDVSFWRRLGKEGKVVRNFCKKLHFFNLYRATYEGCTKQFYSFSFRVKFNLVL